MASVITIKGIDQALSNLHYSNKNAIKHRFICLIRQFYADESSVESIKKISSDELVKALWDTDGSPKAIKNRRKNLSSIKFSVNADLKKLYNEGENPEGIIIGPDNTFVMSEDAKDKVLQEFGTDLISGGSVTLSQIIELLKMTDKTLLGSTEIDNENSTNGLKQLKELVKELSEKIDLVGLELTKTVSETAAKVEPEGESIKAFSDVEGPEEKGTFVDSSDRSPSDEGFKRGAGAFEDGVHDGSPDPDEGVESELQEIEEIEDLEDEEVFEEDEVLEEDEISDAVDDAGTDGVSAGEGAGDSLEEAGGGLEQGKNFGPKKDAQGSGGSDGESPLAGDSGLSPSDEGFKRGAGASEDGVHDGSSDPDEGVESELQEIEEIEDLEDEEVFEEDEVLEEDEISDAVDDAGTDGLSEGAGPGSEQDKEIGVGGDAKGVKGAQEVGLPVDSLGQEYSHGLSDKIKKARLLAEEFDGYLGSMDRYFNHYLLIPAGEYLVGDKIPQKDEKMEQAVRLLPYYMGRFPVTNGLFEIFVEKTGYVTTAEKVGYGTVYYGRFQRTKDERGLITSTWNSSLYCATVEGACWHQPTGPGSTLHNKRNHPVVQVGLEDAMAFAAWTGKRLPTENEWEAAARTANGWMLPWGQDWEEDSCNIEESCVGDTTPVDRYIEFENDFGLVDIIGNVLEWTSDSSGEIKGKDTGEKYQIARGGSWISGNDISLVSRFKLEPESHSNILGFRCIAY